MTSSDRLPPAVADEVMEWYFRAWLARRRRAAWRPPKPRIGTSEFARLGNAAKIAQGRGGNRWDPDQARAASRKHWGLKEE